MNWYRFNFRRLEDAAAFAFRLTAAAVLALWLSNRLHVTLPLWAVLTALVVTQISLGRSLKATLDYFAATLGGVLWGGLVAIAVPHSSEAALLAVLMLALAPLAFLAALYPRLTVGPVTAAIVVLIPQMIHTTPIASALERITEVSLGGLTGLAVSFVLIPSSAFQHTREIAADSLGRMAEAVPALIEGFKRGLSEAEAHRTQDGIGQRLSELSSAASEAERERPLRWTGDPLTGPLSRTLLRLRHDLVMLGRAARWPLPASLEGTLQPALLSLGKEISGYLHECAAALLSRKPAPSHALLDLAFSHYTAEIEVLRKTGSLRELASEDLERVFTTAFALEQMRLNLQDLDRCAGEWASRRE